MSSHIKKKKKKKGAASKPKARRFSAMTLLEQAEYEIALSQSHQREMEIRDLFTSLDVDNSGHIDREELKPLLIKMGFDETTCTHDGFERFLSEEFKRADTSGDKKIDFSEFAALHNRLCDTKKDIMYLNRAIALVDSNTTLSSEDYLQQVEQLATASMSIDSLSIDVVAALDSLGDKPSQETLQVFTCILILFGLPERETPDEDWKAAQAVFDAPNFLEDLRTFDHSKLRRAQVHRCIQRSKPLVGDFRRLETKQPLAFSLLCWVLVTVAIASKDGVLDQVDEEEVKPVSKRASFVFSLGTNARKGVFRILDSDLFTGDFHRKRDASSPGVTLQVGTLEDTFKQAIAAIFFDRSKFTEEQAGEWWTSHKEDGQFKTALEAMQSPRVDIQSFDFSSSDSSSSSSTKKKTASAGDIVEMWGYNDEGEFVMTLVSKSEIKSAESDALVEPVLEALADLTNETIAALGETAEDPGHGLPAICVVCLLLGISVDKVPTNWMDAKMWCLSPGCLNSMRSMDVRKISRMTLHRRLREANKYFLDPTLSANNLKSGHPVIHSFVKWGKACVKIAEHPDIVKAGRDIDAKKV